MNLEQEIIDNTAAQMAKDIDTEVLMSAMGWHKLEINFKIFKLNINTATVIR